MRIIAGTHKKRKIVPPKGMKERPTTDRAKEGVFNILENLVDLENASVLDLFAGTGNLAFECASRGSSSITAVERDRKLFAFIERTAKEWGIEGLKVVNDDAVRFLKHCKESYGLIFIDPPYADKAIYPKVLDAIQEKGILKDGGVLVVEHDEPFEFKDRAGFLKTRVFGKARFSFFVR